MLPEFSLSLGDFSSIIELSCALIIAFTGFPEIEKAFQNRIANEIVDIFKGLEENDVKPIFESSQSTKHIDIERYDEYMQYSRECSAYLQTGQGTPVIFDFAHSKIEENRIMMSYCAIYGIFSLICCGLTSSNGTIVILHKAISVSSSSYKVFSLYTFITVLVLSVIFCSNRAKKVLSSGGYTSLFANNFYLSCFTIILSSLIILTAYRYDANILISPLYFGRDIAIITCLIILIIPYPVLYISSYSVVLYHIYELRFRILVAIKSDTAEYTNSVRDLSWNTFKERLKLIKSQPYNRRLLIERFFIDISNAFRYLKYRYIYQNKAYVINAVIYKGNRKQYFIGVGTVIAVICLSYQYIENWKMVKNDILSTIENAHIAQLNAYNHVHQLNKKDTELELSLFYEPSSSALNNIMDTCEIRRTGTICYYLDSLKSFRRIVDRNIDIISVHQDSIQVKLRQTDLIIWRDDNFTNHKNIENSTNENKIYTLLKKGDHYTIKSIQ